MSETIRISKKHKIEFTVCRYSHIWIYIKLTILDETGNIMYLTDEGDKKIFMFDTGAQSTVISKKRFDDLGYKYCEIKGKTRVAIAGNVIGCSKIEIPDITITNDIVAPKPIVLVPDDYFCNINILGQDILQLFNYYMDNQSHNIYFDTENTVL